MLVAGELFSKHLEDGICSCKRGDQGKAPSGPRSWNKSMGHPFRYVSCNLSNISYLKENQQVYLLLYMGKCGYKILEILGLSLLCSVLCYNWPFRPCLMVSMNGPVYRILIDPYVSLFY